jgi:ubiquinone/menaquinone biosynthesis C-methylase UbiE
MQAQDYKQNSRTTFDRLAERYESHHYCKHARGLWDEIVPVIDALHPASILDVGCGTGNLLARLNKEGRKLAGADLSPNRVKHAKEKLGQSVDLRVADSESLPWSAGQFEAIVCTDSFHHYPNPHAVLREMCRLLQVNGHLVIADVWIIEPFRSVGNLICKFVKTGDVKLYSVREWQAMLLAQGLRIIRLEHRRSAIVIVAQNCGASALAAQKLPAF